MFTRTIIAAGALAAAGAFQTAAAQGMGEPATTISFGVRAVASVPSGDDFENLELGYGGQLLVGPRMNSIEILAVGGYRVHGVDVGNDVKLLSFGVQPRYLITLANPVVQPWVGANGQLVLSSSENTTAGADDVKATGFEVGGVAGVMFELASQVGLDIFGNLNYLTFGDASVGDVDIPNSDASGINFNFGVGLTITP